MEPMPLSFGALIAYLSRAISQMSDPRKASNATRYSLKDAVLAAFSVFFMQSESFLDYQRLSCEQGFRRLHKNGTFTYSHSAILPVIVAPGQSQVISLVPEFITPQDGCGKQDSEVAAAKRWIAAHEGEFRESSVTPLGDDLYSRQPMCEVVVTSGMNFIFTCLPTSHSTLYERLKYLESQGEVKTLRTEHWNKSSKEVYNYRYVSEIPLRSAQPAMNVNWVELVVRRESDGKVLYENAFITCHDLTQPLWTESPEVESGLKVQRLNRD